jgi:VWFA-related protein
MLPFASFCRLSALGPMLFRVALGLLFANTLTLAAQQPPAASGSSQSQSARFGTATSGVVVDVVVRDKRGRPVTDLTATDFEILEDSVRQKIVAFEPYTAADVPKTVADAAAEAGVGVGKTASPQRLAVGPPIIALAWDRLNPEARAIAHKAARRLIQTKAPGELVGIFLTDMTLQILQPYTTDGTKLATAVEDLATRATTSASREPSPLDNLVGRAQTSATASAADSGYGLAGFPQARGERSGAGGGEHPETAPVVDIISMLIRMERTYQQFLYEAQGRASLLGLLALVDSLGQLPGRKTVLYFCEGLTIPESQQARFRAVIDTANRNNVSVYTFDAAGLRVHSAQQQTAREIQELTFTALGSVYSRSEKWTEELENNERLLKMDPAVSLSILADQTGGMLTNNTNALDRAIDRINDDRRHHYLLSYVSTNSTLDGTYRKIEVRVPRGDVEVRARRGYRASPNGTTAPVLEYDQPAMTALSATPVPSAFPIAARAVHTPMPDRLGLVSVLIGVNGASLTLGRSQDGTQYLAGATVLARVVGTGQREVARVSQQYRFTGDYEQRNTHRRGVLFFRTASLPPGAHVVEAVVYDVMGERSAVVRRPLETATVSSQTVVGDLIVASRVEPAPQEQPGTAEHPLVWQGMLYTPSFGEPISLDAFDVTVALPLVVAGEVPQATLELRRGQQTLKNVPLPAGPALPSGRLMLVGRLPIDDLSAGEYELRVMVTQGGQATMRTASITLVDTAGF